MYLSPIWYSWKSASQTCTGSGNSLGDCFLLANTAMVPTICAVGEARDKTAVHTIASTYAPAATNKLTTPDLRSAQSGNSNFADQLPTAGLLPDVTQIT